jgi:hypothetical protein
MSEELQKTVERIIREGSTRARGIKEALDFVGAILSSMEPERTKLIAEQSKMEASLKALTVRAMKTQSEADVLELSKVHADCERLGKMLFDGVKIYSEATNELEKLERMETIRVAPIATTGVSIKTLRNKVAIFVQEMCDYWSAYYDAFEPRKEAVVCLKINSRMLTMNTSDVRGDGACGWRAFLTGIVRVLTGGRIHLSYDPHRMTEFVEKVKVLMLELVGILSKNQANSDFITSVFNNPDNCGRKTIGTYTTMVSETDYQMTNFEMRLLCVLFGLFDECLSQVNIIRKTPQFGEIYQSLSASGSVVPVSNEHINILHVPGHYMSIVKLTEGVLQHIYSIDDAIHI